MAIDKSDFNQVVEWKPNFERAEEKTEQSACPPPLAVPAPVSSEHLKL